MSSPEELRAWWVGVAEQEVSKVAPKAVEYGAADLKVMGQAMRTLWPGDPVQPDRVFVEMAIAFYALGKCARLFGAYEQGRLPSDDTWTDLAIYTRMAMRVREVGEWPG